MKLKEIELTNVKCFKDYRLELVRPGTDEPLNVCVLIGPNGCGKSTIMEAIIYTLTTLDQEYGGRIFDEKAIKYKENWLSSELKMQLNADDKKILNIADDTLSLLGAKVQLKNSQSDAYQDFMVYPNGFEIDLCESENDEAKTKKEEQFQKNRAKYENILEQLINNKKMAPVLYFDAFRYLPSSNPQGINMDIMSNVRKDSLRSNVNEDNTISNKYFNVKQWLLNLDYLKLKEGNYYQRVYEHVTRAVDMLFSPLKFSRIETNGNIIFVDDDSKEEIDIGMLSDGFKSLFSIIGAMIMRLSLLGEKEGMPFYMNEAIVLIDEIDCHIHPRWQRNIIPALKILFPNCQYIVSTHSPYILESVQEYEIKQIGERRMV